MLQFLATVLPPVTLTPSDWTKITFPECGSVLIQCRTEEDVYVASTLDPGSAYFTIKGGFSLAMDVKTQGFSMYGKSSSGIVLLERIYLAII